MNLATFIKSRSFCQVATATVATVATFTAPDSATVAKVATVAVANSENPIPESQDPARWAPPALNDAEIAAFLERTGRWAGWLGEARADELAEALLARARDYQDDRVLCLECRHCIAGRCANSAKAGFMRGSAVGDLAVALHRCPGFAPGAGSLAPVAPPTARGHSKPLGHPLTVEGRMDATEYLAHHWACRTCQASGTGHGPRCADGAALWQAYQRGEIL